MGSCDKERRKVKKKKEQEKNVIKMKRESKRWPSSHSGDVEVKTRKDEKKKKREETFYTNLVKIFK